MTLFLATDHAGFPLKETLKLRLEVMGHTIEDLGAHALTPGDDYPSYMQACAERVASTPDSLGIIFGGSGQGEAMVANRVKNVRAAVYYGGPLELVTLAREHNDANILSLGARFVTEEEALGAAQIFIETPFTNDERHVRRINQF